MPSLGIYLEKETFTSLLFKGKEAKNEKYKVMKENHDKISGFNFSCLQTMYVHIYILYELRNSKKKLNNKFKKRRKRRRMNEFSFLT